MRRVISQFRSNDRGATAVEFGFLASLLCFLFVGSIDFGMGYWQKIQVGNAARAGAQYAMTNGFNQSGITAAVTGATGLASISASPSPTQACGCPNATSGLTVATCGAACAGGGTAGTYITVNAAATYSTLLSYPGIASSFSLAATDVVRIN